MSSKDVADSIRRIVAVRDGALVTVGYEQNGLSFVGMQDAPYDARPDLPGRRGQSDRAGQTGGGIASPLTEEDIAKREYYPDRLITSSDGLFTLVVKPIKAVYMRDASGATVELRFAEPPTEQP